MNMSGSHEPGGILLAAARTHQKIGEILTQAGRLSLPQLRRALKKQADLSRSTGARPRIGEMLVEHQLIDDVELARALAVQQSCRYLDPDPTKVRPTLFADIPREIVRSYRFVPLGRDHGSVSIAVCDFEEPDLMEVLASVTGLAITRCVTTEERLLALRKQYLSTLEGFDCDADLASASSKDGKQDSVGGAASSKPAGGGDPVPPARKTAAGKEAETRSPTWVQQKQKAQERGTSVESKPARSGGERPTLLPSVKAQETHGGISEPIEVPVPCAIDNVLYRLMRISIQKRYLNVALTPSGETVQVLAHRDGGRTELLRTGSRMAARLRQTLETMMGLSGRRHQRPIRRKLRWVHELGTALFEVIFDPPASRRLDINLLQINETSWGYEDLGLTPDALRLVREYVAADAGVVAIASRVQHAAYRFWVATLATHAARGRSVVSIEQRVGHALGGITSYGLDSCADGGAELFSRAAAGALKEDPCDVLALRTDEVPGNLQDLLTAGRGRAATVLNLTADSSLGALKALEQVTRNTFSDGLLVSAHRLPRLCPFCREDFAIPASKLPPSHQDLQDRTAYRSRGCDSCQHSGQFGPVHFHEVLRLDRARLDRVGIDFYARSLKDYLLENGLLVLARPAARKALLDGIIGLDEYLSLAARQ